MDRSPYSPLFTSSQPIKGSQVLHKTLDTARCRIHPSGLSETQIHICRQDMKKVFPNLGRARPEVDHQTSCAPAPFASAIPLRVCYVPNLVGCSRMLIFPKLAYRPAVASCN